MFKLFALLALTSVLVSVAQQQRNLRIASNLLPHGPIHPPRDHRYQIQIDQNDAPSKKAKRSQSRPKRNVGTYPQSIQYTQPSQPYYPQQQGYVSIPQQPYIQQPVQYIQLPHDPRYPPYLIQQGKQLIPPQGYEAQPQTHPQTHPQQSTTNYYQPAQQQVVYQQQSQNTQVPTIVSQPRNINNHQQVQIPQQNVVVQQIPSRLPVQQHVHQGSYQETPYAGKTEVYEERTTIYQQRPQVNPTVTEVRPAQPYQRIITTGKPFVQHRPQPVAQPVPIAQPIFVAQPVSVPHKPQTNLHIVDEQYVPTKQIEVNPAVESVTAPVIPARAPELSQYIEEPYVPVTVEPITYPSPVPSTQPPQTLPPITTTQAYDPITEPITPNPYDAPEPEPEECFYNPSGYICCNELLNDIMVKTYQELENRPKFHTCNVQALVNILQKRLEETFNTPFETIAGYDDFAQKVNYKDDLVCKVELNGRYIMAYASVGAAESKKVARAFTI